MNETYDDESLKQEVVYLHSLWLRGPPTRNPNPVHNWTPMPTQNPTLNQYPRSRPNYIPPEELHLSHHYGPVGRTQYRSRNPNPHHYYHPYNRPGFNPFHKDTGPEWPVKEEAPLSPRLASGWREFKPNRGGKSEPLSAELLAKLSAAKLQKEVLQTCREFFRRKTADEDGDGGDKAENDEGDEDYLLENDGSKENDESEFFSRLFKENSELKGYYEKNQGKGEFVCLVCGSTGKKMGRTFKSCLAIVQHSLAIHKTDSKMAHRAFAQAVCDVLGWDINNPVAGSLKHAQSSSKEDGGNNQVENPQSVTSDDCKGSGASKSADVEWPTSWPSKREETSEMPVVSAEEEARIRDLQIQQKVSEACRDFFDETVNSDNEDEEEDNDVDSVEEDDGVSKESEEFNFFTTLFSENSDLKTYYEKNYESGEFFCLVCAGIGKKPLKSFKHCSGLLQHSTKVLNTKKKHAHRTFARAVCEVFGWDFDRIPLIVVKGENALGGSSVNQNDDKLVNKDANNIDNEAKDDDEATKPPLQQ